MLLSHGWILRINAALLLAADTVESETSNTWQSCFEHLLPKWLEGPVLVAAAILTLAASLALVVFWIIDKLERSRLNAFFHEGKRFRTSKVKYSFFSRTRTKEISIYSHREIEKTILEHIRNGRNVVLLGTPLKGKTRTMVECLRQIKRADCTIALPSKFDGEIRFPRSRRRWFSKKHILVLDDLQDFFRSPNDASRLIYVANLKGFIIVANCRSSGEWQAVKNRYETISSGFTEVIIPEPTDEEVNAVVQANNLLGIPKFYDHKNIGTLIIDLDTMRDRYEAATVTQRKILLCIKELHLLGITNDKGEIEGTKIKLLAEKAHDLAMSDDVLKGEKDWVVDNDFATIKDRGLIPETVYLSQIIEPGYPLCEIIENGLKAFPKNEIKFTGLIYSAPDGRSALDVLDLMKVKRIPRNIDLYNQLIAKQRYDAGFEVYRKLLNDGIIPDKQTFYTLINIRRTDGTIINEREIPVFEKACEVFGGASKSEPKDAHIFYYWGTALIELARAKGDDEKLFREAFDKYKRATEIKPDDHRTFCNWGSALAELARATDNDEKLFRESFDNFKRAAVTDPDCHITFHNWGRALVALARVKGDDEKLFREAFDKYKRATEIKPDDHRTFCNWGSALAELATAKGDDEKLFAEACEKYQRATELKPDDHEAFYAWGSTLDDLAIAKDNDDLFREACKKYERATEIKPDKHEAFYNWGLLLDLLASLKGNDEKLLAEAKEKRLTAHRLRPDLVDEDGNRI